MGLIRKETNIIAMILVWKTALFLIAWIWIESSSGFRIQAFQNLVHWPKGMEPTWQSRLATWDGAHYLKISMEGYRAGEASCAFYPLWPFFIRTYACLFGGDPFWSGLILANALSILAIVFLYKITALLESEQIAQSAVILCLAFPGAIFLSLIYTEPLFFTLSTAVFFLLLQRRFWTAAMLALFLPLTRPVGILIVVPLAWECIRYSRQPVRDLFSIGLPVCGYGLYFLTMAIWTGNSLEGFDAQRHFPTQPEVSKIWDLPSFLHSFLDVNEIHSSRGSLIDRLFFVLFLVTLPFVFKIRTSFGLYVLLLGLISSVSTHLISFSRHIVMCFPIMIAITQVFIKIQGITLFRVFSFLLFIIQFFFWIRYLDFKWAG